MHLDVHFIEFARGGTQIGFRLFRGLAHSFNSHLFFGYFLAAFAVWLASNWVKLP